MPSVKSLLVAGLAAAAVVGIAGAAVAAGARLHTLTVNLPRGGVAVIHYAGDVPPQVTLARVAPGADPAAWPGPLDGGWAAPFADLARVSAEMDRQADAMLRMAMTAPPLAAPGQTLADFGRLPAGAQSYSFVSSTMGPSACGRSTEVISQGAGRAPRVITRSWGDCAGAPAAGATSAGAVAGPTTTSDRPGAAPLRQPAGPHLIETSATLDR